MKWADQIHAYQPTPTLRLVDRHRQRNPTLQHLREQHQGTRRHTPFDLNLYLLQPARAEGISVDINFLVDLEAPPRCRHGAFVTQRCRKHGESAVSVEEYARLHAS